MLNANSQLAIIKLAPDANAKRDTVSHGTDLDSSLDAVEEFVLITQNGTQEALVVKILVERLLFVTMKLVTKQEKMQSANIKL